jgi:hypothetical protein
MLSLVVVVSDPWSAIFLHRTLLPFGSRNLDQVSLSDTTAPAILLYRERYRFAFEARQDRVLSVLEKR